MIAAMRNVTTAAAVVVMLAWSTHAQQPGQAPGDQEPVAQVGDRIITAREADERWKADSPAQQMQARQALYDGRRAAVDALVSDVLLDRGAKAKGLPRDQFEAAEMARRARPVTDGDVAAYYRANRNQTEGRSLEEMRPILREFLEERSETIARAELIADLKRTEPRLRVMLDAPRQPIEISVDDPSLGPADAPVTLVEFADFQCPFCGRLLPTIKQLRQRYGDRLRVVWKDFPLRRIHPQAFHSAEAANCAREQGKFWEYHDRLFSNQQALSDAALKQYARDSGIDAARFDACLDSSKYEARVRDAAAVAARLGFTSTPTTYINGRMISGAKPYEAFRAVIDDELDRMARR